MVSVLLMSFVVLLITFTPDRLTPNLRCVSSTARVLVAHYAYVQNRKFLAYR